MLARSYLICLLLCLGCQADGESDSPVDAGLNVILDGFAKDAGDVINSSDSSADVTGAPDFGPEIGTQSGTQCNCGALEYCSPAGVCESDVCLQGTTTCDSLAARLICSPDGSTATVEHCELEMVCYLGQCHLVVCSGADPAYCDGEGGRLVCNGLGTDWTPIPCPGGTACEGGACEPIRPNVILVVDTSDSMNDLYDKPGAAAGSCSGDDCPPWDFPNCEDPQAPQTRLGRVKQALRQLVESPASDAARIALQRFPQTPSHESGCDHGYWGSLSSISGHDDEHFVDDATLDDSLGQIMVAPFSATQKSSDVETMKLWTDFQVSVVPTDVDCDYDWDCSSKLCEGSPLKCQETLDPELRAVGSTPLGMSLFYAAEYLRSKVLVEGKPCAVDTDCGSPNHSCQAGACRDPHVACRQTAIILFTDGQETSHEDSADFFNPANQARRLHFGLGCAMDMDCTNGAVCQELHCVPPAGALPDSVPFAPFADPEGQNHLLGLDGLPLPITVHLVDASNGGTGSDTNVDIATWGGGQHVPVDLEDIDSLVSDLLVLLDIKAPSGCGP